ncbi:MAG: hypothetical protein ACRDMV_10690 [Streptosporangiales bacterium]
MDASLTLRSRDALDRAYQRWRGFQERDRNEPGVDDTAPVTDGTVAALAWVLGESDSSPLLRKTGVDVSDPEHLDRERRVATRMLHGDEAMDSRGRMYVSGVEDTLMWAVGLSDTPL